MFPLIILQIIWFSFEFTIASPDAPFEFFEDADLFLVTGSDTTQQHPLIASRIINAVIDRGAKLIVVDPRKIELAKYATVYMPQNHGTRNALFHHH